ncbi:hypothetical protein Tco_1316423 [Tanacetum coccineum]
MKMVGGGGDGGDGMMMIGGVVEVMVHGYGSRSVAAGDGEWRVATSGGLHYLLDKVVQVGMYRDLSLRTRRPLQDPTTATLTTITITNGDRMPRVGTFRETLSQSKVNNGKELAEELMR